MTGFDVRQAIRVRFHGPTTYRGARYSVTDGKHHGMETRLIYVDIDASLSIDDSRVYAAQEFLDTFVNSRWKEEGWGIRAELTPIGLMFEGDTFFTWHTIDTED